MQPSTLLSRTPFSAWSAPLAAYLPGAIALPPKLNEQVTKLRSLSHWDDTTTALLESVAKKFVKEDRDFHLELTGDEVLSELIEGNWQGPERDIPPWLKAFAQSVARELENHPDDYLALLSTDAADAVDAVSLGATASNFCTGLAWKFLEKALVQLLFKASPLSAYYASSKDVYQTLLQLYQGHYSPQRKLEKLSELFARLSRDSAVPNQGIRSVLKTLADSLQSMSTHWQALERLGDTHTGVSGN